MASNPLQSQTEKRDDLVNQCGFLTRRISDQTNVLKEMESTIAQYKDEISALIAQKKHFIESEIPTITDLIRQVKANAKAHL